VPPSVWPAAIAITFGAALIIAALATPLARRLGLRLGLVDLPGGRRRHEGAVTRIGGVGLFAGFFVTAAGLFVLGVYRPEHRLPLEGVLLGTALVFAFGLADDRFGFSARPQFLAQLAAAAIAIGTTVFIGQVTLPFLGLRELPWFITYPLTILWVVGMMNTVNFLDGLDGLAAGVGTIAALLFAVHSYSLGQHEIALYSLALAGSCLGFLIFNFHPARVFLGSAGAMTLGYALATLSILAPARVATALLVMAIPIADTAFQIYDRWRRGQSPARGDRGHLHYRLIDLGLSQRQIVVGYWLFCAVFGGLALLISAPVYKLLAIGMLGVIVVAVLAALRRRQAAGALNARQP
jgi:UDP-GlcNAc:undecaprenyl-phosphate/decaprenyl-phosphate GlcNAc-1-phosphate transferase